jgi:hypothetical protein
MCLYHNAEFLAHIATFFGFLFAVVTLFIGLSQYHRSQQFKKAEYFFELRKVFKGTEKYNNLRKSINETGDFNLITPSEIWDYMGFFEELQIAINSKFVSPEMVFYFFGVYILKLNEMVLKNSIASKNDKMWSVFFQLVDTMQKINADKTITFKSLKF